MKKYWAKFEKGTDRLIGYLSKGKKRWLPEVSKHEHLVIRSYMVLQDLRKEFESKYGWQKETHNYYYKEVDIRK